jgi:hypothetical protein
MIADLEYGLSIAQNHAKQLTADRDRWKADAERLADAARECVGLCDHHHGIAAEPDRETYCFTLYERCPCSLDGLADALSAHDSLVDGEGQ